MSLPTIHPGYQSPSPHADRRCRDCFHLDAATDATEGQCFGESVGAEACCDLFTAKSAVAGFTPNVGARSVS